MAYDDSAVRWEQLDPVTYEMMVAVLLSTINPAVERTDGAGGDGGRDVSFDSPDGLEIYELKSFSGRVGRSQRRQIARSLSRAADHSPARWHLIVPLDLNPTEKMWFDALTDDYPFECVLHGLTWLDARMASHPAVSRYFLQGGAAEVVNLLKEIGREEAGLVGGVPDLVRRLQRLSARADEIDPHYSFAFGVDGSGRATIALTPRYLGAEKDRPITMSLSVSFPDTDEGHKAEEEFADSLKYGSKAFVPTEFVQNVTVDAPAGLALTGGSASILMEAMGSEGPDFKMHIVVSDPERNRLASVPLTFGHRTVGAGGFEALAQDPTGSIQCRIRMDFETHQLHLTYGIELPPRCLPTLAIPTVFLATQFCAPNSLELCLVDGQPIGPPIELTNDEPAAPISFLKGVEAFARIQEHAHTYFDLPGEGLSDEDLAELVHSNALVQEGSVEGVWSERLMEQNVESFVQAAHEVGIDILAGESFVTFHVAQRTITLTGHSIPLGWCTYVYRSTEVANLAAIRLAYEEDPSQVVTIKLKPGKTDQVSIQLGKPPDFDSKVQS